MKQFEYTFITGLWDKETIVSFLESIALQIDSKKIYQLNQTFSECSIEFFKPEYSPDIKYLEQYRAFCIDWELWIRNINSQEMRFRFILKGNTLSSDKINSLKTVGFNIDNKTTLVQEQKFPLWGKPLLFNDKKGWYTEQIPQILNYPVYLPEDTKNKRVYLKVENMLREDGTVDIVRYVGMEVS
jgi:hypothetical protein